MATTCRTCQRQERRGRSLFARAGWRCAAIAWIGVMWLGASAAAAEPPPTPIEASEDGVQIRVPGEPPPAVRVRLPLPRVGRTAADTALATAPIPVALAGTPTEASEPPAPVVAVAPLVEVSTGYTWLPRGLFSSLQSLSSGGRRDQHPLLQGWVIDGGYRKPVGDSAWLVWRGGITIPLIPAQNWWSSSGSPAPVYTEVQLAVIEGGADYLRRVALTPKLQWTVRGGLGLMVLAGSISRTETLPNCTAAQAATCPHWRFVGRSGSGVPPVLPVVRALTGLAFQIAPGWSVAVEAGLRTVPFAGVTVGYQL